MTNKKRIVLMCSNDFARPLSKYGFEVFCALPLVYQLFYRGKENITLSLDEFSKYLNIYKEKIIEFSPAYFIADSGFFAGVLGRLEIIRKEDMVSLWVSFVEDLNKRGVLTIVSCVDDPWQFAVGKKDIFLIRKIFRVVKTHSMQLEDEFLKCGQKVIHSPSYVDVSFILDSMGMENFTAEETAGAVLKGFDLFFVGRMNLDRKIFFWRLSRKLRGFDYFFGNHDFFYTSRKEISFDLRNKRHIQQLYNKSLVNIIYGDMNELLFKRSWGVSDRVFNIPYCHGFFLCDWRRDLLDLFDIDPKLYTFRTPRQCYSKIKLYLENSNLRKDLSDKFREHVIRYHTVDKRAERFICDLEN